MMRFTYSPPEGIPEELMCDQHLLVVNKPSGLLSNPGIADVTHDCALNRLRAHYGELYLVHRLDCDTSGLLVLARTKAAERHLKIQWQERQVEKRYQALVFGTLSHSHGEIDAAIQPDRSNPPFQVISLNGKPAFTRYQLLCQYADYARLALFPQTGRTHQLRVHLLSLGYPILGDPFYGHPASQSAQPRLCLHADQLCFTHPDGSALVLESRPDF